MSVSSSSDRLTLLLAANDALNAGDARGMEQALRSLEGAWTLEETQSFPYELFHMLAYYHPTASRDLLAVLQAHVPLRRYDPDGVNEGWIWKVVCREPQEAFDRLLPVLDGAADDHRLIRLALSECESGRALQMIQALVDPSRDFLMEMIREPEFDIAEQLTLIHRLEAVHGGQLPEPIQSVVLVQLAKHADTEPQAAHTLARVSSTTTLKARGEAWVTVLNERHWLAIDHLAPAMPSEWWTMAQALAGDEHPLPRLQASQRSAALTRQPAPTSTRPRRRA